MDDTRRNAWPGPAGTPSPDAVNATPTTPVEVESAGTLPPPGAAL
ncbi:hypothetical protein ACFZAU_02540 [Streptomyces sp. NPDC008238]